VGGEKVTPDVSAPLPFGFPWYTVHDAVGSTWGPEALAAEVAPAVDRATALVTPTSKPVAASATVKFRPAQRAVAEQRLVGRGM
jgi:hypothetical protein